MIIHARSLDACATSELDRVDLQAAAWGSLRLVDGLPRRLQVPLWMLFMLLDHVSMA
jgi:hypothetical protein